MAMPSRRARHPFWMAVASVLAVAPVLGGVANVPIFPPIKDNSIYEEDLLSNGAGEHLFSGNTSLLTARRALLVFDVAGAVVTADIPPGSRLTAVALQLWCTQSPLPNPVPQEFSLHRLTADWGAAGSDAGDPGGGGAPAQTGDATWSERFFGQGMPWATPGGDFVASPSATVTVGTCNEVTPTNVFFDSTPGLIADVQAWLDDPASNFGWILIGNEAAATTARRFASGDNDQLPQVPSLQLVFDVGDGVPATSPTGVALLVLLMATALAFALRRGRRTG